jgi:CHAD domain-containing protein
LAELDASLQLLRAGTAPSSRRVHETRKHVKRTRAMLVLLGRKRSFQRFDARLQLVGRSLGAVRDAAAQAATWAEGAERFDEPVRAAIGDALRERAEREAAQERELRRLGRAERVLTGVRAALALALAGKTRGNDERLERAARLSYRKARRALATAGKRPTADSVHALRRAAKRHQYQMQFLERFWQKPLKAQRKQLGHLTELLGLHHDVCAMELKLQQLSGSLAVESSSWREGFEHWQKELLRAALELAEPAFSQRPRAFQRRLHGYASARERHASAAMS